MPRLPASAKRMLRTLQYRTRGLLDHFESNEIPAVDEAKWKSSLTVQWDWFHEKDKYLGQLRGLTEPSDIKSRLLAVCQEKLHRHDAEGFPLLELLTSEKLENRKILHLASGIYASLLPVVRTHGFEYYLEDPLLDKIDETIPYRAMLQDEVRDFCSLPAEQIHERYPDGTFDIVLCLNVLNHTCQPQRILDNIVKVLKPGGRLFVHHIDQPAIGSHPLRIIRRQLEGYFSAKGLSIEFENHVPRPAFRRTYHQYVLRRPVQPLVHAVNN
jgi:ubiquinone/menaquinone biosynthesis C-methylase UbiE